MNFDYYMAHRYCVPDEFVWLSNFVLEMAIGLMYFVFVYFCYKINRAIQDDSNWTRVRVFHWLIPVFTFCGLAKWLHALNVFVGFSYAFLPANNTLLLVFMVALLVSSYRMREILQENLKSITNDQLENAIKGMPVKPSPASYQVADKSRSFLQEVTELARRVQYMELAINQMPIHVAIVDQGMNYIVLSDAWREYFGRHNSRPGMNHYETFPNIPTDKPEWVEDHRQTLLEGITQYVDNENFEGSEFGWLISPLFSYENSTLGHTGNIAGMVMMVFPNDEKTPLRIKPGAYERGNNR